MLQTMTIEEKKIPPMNREIDAEEISKIIMCFTAGKAEANQLRIWLRDLSKEGCWCSGVNNEHSPLCQELQTYFGIK